MNDNDLDQLLTRLRDVRLPAAPEIGERLSRAVEGGGPKWRAGVSTIRGAMQLAACVAIFSMGAGLVMGTSIGRLGGSMSSQALRASLLLDVFEPDLARLDFGSSHH